jgi:hypothetical protein
MVRIFKNRGRDNLSDHIRLEDTNDVDFVFVETIIRPAHILPPMAFVAGRTANFYTVADLVDHDMYLRLLHMR